MTKCKAHSPEAKENNYHFSSYLKSNQLLFLYCIIRGTQYWIPTHTATAAVSWSASGQESWAIT